MAKLKHGEHGDGTDIVGVTTARRMLAQMKSKSMPDVADAWVLAQLTSQIEAFNAPLRAAATLSAAIKEHLLGPGIEKDARVGGRVALQLLEAAKARSGISSTTQLLEYALAKVAIEDDFGEFLVSQVGTIDADLDLEF